MRELGHERHFLMRQANDKKAKARPQKNEEVEIDDIKVKPQGYSTEGRHEDIIEWERPGSKKQQGNPMINKLIDLQNKVSSSREKLGTLRCENNSLIRERDRWKQQASELETAANKLKTAYEKKMKCLELKVSRSEKEKDTIASDLNRTMKQEQRGLRDENERLSKMLKDAEQKHHDDTEALRDDLLSSQRIEQQLRSKVSQIQRDHAEEIESVKVDRDASIAKKDAEIARLEEKVTKLEKTNLEEKEVYQNMLSEAEQLHEKDIQTLQTELNRAQEKERELEEELNELQTAHAEELEKRMTKTLDYDSKQNEIAKLQKTLQEQEEKSEKEKEELRTQLRKAEEKHEQELSRMKEEVFWAQESQRQLKSELSELQTVHAEEIESVKQEAAQKPDGAPITDEKTKEMREQLEQQEAAFREEKEELCKMLREADDKYRCEIDGLKEEIREAQGANEQLRFELTKSQTAHAEEVETLTMDLVDSHEKDLEISQLKETIQEQEESFEREKEELHERLKEHLDEVRALKEDFVETQNAHMFHLHCILDMLEDMDADREKNMAELLNELDAIQLAKDSKIQELESELFFQRSRQQHSPDLSTIEEDVESNLDSTSTSTNSELNLARQAIEEHAAERLKRSDEFNTTLKNLQLAVKPENMKYIFEKLQKQHYYNSGAEMKVFSEIHRMTKVLGELYANEERSQDEIDKNTMVLLDRFLTTSSSSGYSSRC